MTATAPLKPAPDSSAPTDRRILLAVKLKMIERKAKGKELSLSDRLRMASGAGFDGVDFNEAGSFSLIEVRRAVRETGVFVHNALNGAHWEQRLTSHNDLDRRRARANLEHCIRLSHGVGGNSVLIVLGDAKDGPAAVIEPRCRIEIAKLIPLAASLGQRILIENVWNKMMYEHDAPPEQSPDHFIQFIDSFRSPWVGMYFDVGNHWKYAQPGSWIRALGPRCVKLDLKGFSRAKDKFVDIGSAEDDLPWNDVRAALHDISFTGWATAEVPGGDLKRLTAVREQMQKVLAV